MVEDDNTVMQTDATGVTNLTGRVYEKRVRADIIIGIGSWKNEIYENRILKR